MHSEDFDSRRIVVRHQKKLELYNIGYSTGRYQGCKGPRRWILAFSAWSLVSGSF